MEHLSIKEQIDRALEENGVKQKWVINKMKELGFEMSESTFSQKKYSSLFTEKELKSLSRILKTKLSYAKSNDKRLDQELPNQ
jgi:hypothetical protein